MFLILLGYFMIRPVRETTSSIVGTDELQRLFLASFITMLLIVPAYSALVARLPRRWLVRTVYHFFAASLLVFWGLRQIEDPTVELWTARVLFVWISVFGLFATSVFWSVLADLYTSNQGKRLFGLIAGGGTAGAISGSLIASQLATQLSTSTLLLLPIVVIEAGLLCAWQLERQAETLWEADPEGRTSDESADRPTGGGLLAGVTHVVRSPYLASICLFLFFVQACGTQLYFQQADIVREAIPSEQSRTQLFAYIDLGTQLLTLLLQTSVAGVVLRRLGVSAALVLLPMVYMLGFAALAWHQSLAVMVCTAIAARAAGYGIAVPAREVLFTVVPREDKYKSKSFIDTVVLRGADTISGQIFGTLRGWGIGLSALNLYALPVTGLWAFVAWRLGRRQRQLAEKNLSMTIPSE